MRDVEIKLTSNTHERECEPNDREANGIDNDRVGVERSMQQRKCQTAEHNRTRIDNRPNDSQNQHSNEHTTQHSVGPTNVVVGGETDTQT